MSSNVTHSPLPAGNALAAGAAPTSSAPSTQRPVTQQGRSYINKKSIGIFLTALVAIGGLAALYRNYQTSSTPPSPTPSPRPDFRDEARTLQKTYSCREYLTGGHFGLPPLTIDTHVANIRASSSGCSVDLTDEGVDFLCDNVLEPYDHTGRPSTIYKNCKAQKQSLRMGGPVNNEELFGTVPFGEDNRSKISFHWTR